MERATVMHISPITLSLLVVAASPASAQDLAAGSAPAAVTRNTATCPDESKLKNMCMAVGNQMKDLEPGRFKYLFQRKLYEAACIQPGDSADAASRKYREMWNQFQNSRWMHCDNTSFDVADGNILKYAVSRKFGDFIDEAIARGFNLDHIDESDDRTVLDYARFHENKNKGNELESLYAMFHFQLRKANAKYRSELINSSGGN